MENAEILSIFSQRINTHQINILRMVSKTLKDYETILSPHNFLRIQQSHLVNLDFIDRYDKANGGVVVMKDGAEVPLSHAKREHFFNLIEKVKETK